MTKTGAGTLTVGGTSNPTGLYLRGGELTFASGAAYNTVNPTASTSNYYMSVGLSSGDSGDVVVSGGATLIVAGDLNVADQTGSAGTLNVQSSAAVNVRNLYVGKTGTASGQVFQTGGIVTEADNGTTPVDWRIGGSASTSDKSAVGVYTLSAGGLNTGTANLSIGTYGTGTVVQTGGTLTAGATLSIGQFNTGVGAYNLSGGTVAATAGPRFIVGDVGNGTLRITGPATLNAAILSVGRTGGTGSSGAVLQSAGTVNASGGVVFGEAATGTSVVTASYTLGNGSSGSGTLSTPSVTQATGSTKITGTLTFNGGTIAPTASTTTFIQGLSKANVSSGGARVDTSTYDVTVAQPLPHDTALPGADGGLTKLGTGTLRLSGAETYTGPTTVSAGELAVNGTVAAASAVTVPTTGTLAGTGTVNGTVSLSGTVTAGTGPTATDTIGALHTGVQTWLAGGQFALKIDPTKSVPDPTERGKSGTAGSANDELVLSGLSTASTGLTVDPVLLGTSSFSAGQYSFVIADATGSATAFNNILSSINVTATPADYAGSVSVLSDGTGGEDLLFDLAVAPEPASLALLLLSGGPLLLGRRQRRRGAAVSPA